MTRLVIEPIGLHWLYDKEPTDLCAHGGIRVSVDGTVVFEQGGGLTLSTGALHLLRTIERNYDPDSGASGQLIPCCGHWMSFDQGLGEVVNSPCPNGIDWTVVHIAGAVKVRTSDKLRFVFEEAE